MTNRLNAYSIRPEKIAMGESAWEEFQRLRDHCDDLDDALDYVLDTHMQHVRNLLAEDQLSQPGAVIVTDIPEFDLSLVDAHFPALNQRQVTLFSKASATMIAHTLTRQHSAPIVRH
jgi:hypothetical protein